MEFKNGNQEESRSMTGSTTPTRKPCIEPFALLLDGKAVFSASEWADATVGIINRSIGTPIVTVAFSGTNRYGVNFAEVKRALHEHYVIVRLVSADDREVIELSVDYGNIIPED